MAAIFVQRGTPSPVFAKFPDLPAEIRCLIWAKASTTRPRVIQIAYESEIETWRAYADSCGGLPRIIPVCREARQEALKPYTRLLDTWVHLEEDTIFISDPMFNIRKPRSKFMDSAYLSSIKKVAFTDDVYFGMKLLYESFSTLVDNQAAIVRKMQGLTHCILVLSEDGGGFESESDEAEFEVFDEDDEADYEDDWPSPGPGSEGEHDLEPAEQDEHESMLAILEEGASEPGIPRGGDTIQDGDNDEEQWLSVQEEEAMERLTKGYFRCVGDIHFNSAQDSPDFWDSWYQYQEQIDLDFAEQEKEDSAWKRPLVAIVEVRYGLYPMGYAPDIAWRGAPALREHISEDGSDDGSEVSV